MVDVDAVDLASADAGDGIATTRAVLALVGLDPLPLLCTLDFVLGGAQQ